jgi:hypothetical protein
MAGERRRQIDRAQTWRLTRARVSGRELRSVAKRAVRTPIRRPIWPWRKRVVITRTGSRYAPTRGPLAHGALAATSPRPGWSIRADVVSPSRLPDRRHSSLPRARRSRRRPAQGGRSRRLPLIECHAGSSGGSGQIAGCDAGDFRILTQRKPGRTDRGDHPRSPRRAPG